MSQITYLCTYSVLRNIARNVSQYIALKESHAFALIKSSKSALSIPNTEIVLEN